MRTMLLAVALLAATLVLNAQQANNACYGQVKKTQGAPIIGHDTYEISRCSGACDPSHPCQVSQTTGKPGKIGETGYIFCGCGGAPEAEPGCCHIAFGIKWCDDGNGISKSFATGEVQAFGSCALAQCPAGGSCTLKKAPFVGGVFFTADCLKPKGHAGKGKGPSSGS